MIKLDENIFSTLLTDFYAVFAPQKISGVPNIVEKYKNTSLDQRNAIQTAYVIYFQNSNPHFKDNYKYFSSTMPETGTETNIMRLMESYARGERICSPEIIEKQLRNLEEARKKQYQEELNKQKQSVTEVDEIKKQLSQINQNVTEVDELKKQIQQLNQELENNNKTPQTIISSVFEDMEVEITSFIEQIQDQNGKIIYSEVDVSKIKMPEKKYFATLCIGQRMMLPCVDGRVIGVEVSNIYDDYISNEDMKPIRILELKKV